jgi:hypothetical protein
MNGYFQDDEIELNNLQLNAFSFIDYDIKSNNPLFHYSKLPSHTPYLTPTLNQRLLKCIQPPFFPQINIAICKHNEYMTLQLQPLPN